MKYLLILTVIFWVGSGFLIVDESTLSLLKTFPEIVIYDLKTNKTMGPPYVEYPTMKAEEGEQGQTEGSQEAEENGWPCKCQDRTCGCCFGMNINQFNFSQESKC